MHNYECYVNLINAYYHDDDVDNNKLLLFYKATLVLPAPYWMHCSLPIGCTNIH